MRIALLGPFGGGNLGDAAIQDAVIHNLSARIRGATLVGISHNPEDTARRHGIPAYPLTRHAQVPSPHVTSAPRGVRSLRTLVRQVPGVLPILSRLRSAVREGFHIRDAFRLVRSLDCLVISGGGQLDDYWGGPWGHPYTLLKWAALSKLTGARVVFLGVGADMFTSRLSRVFVKRALLLADFRSYRDSETKALAESLGVGDDDRVCPDLAYSLPVGRANAGVLQPDSTPHTVGISPIAAGAWTSRDDPRYRNYLTQLCSATSWLLCSGYSVRLFPSQVRMDAPVINEMVEVLRDQGETAWRGELTVHPVQTVADLIDCLATVDVVVASRLHGVLLSTLMHKPVVAVSYARKVELLMGDLGVSDCLLDGHTLRSEDLVERVRYLCSSHARIRQHLSGAVEAYRTILDSQYARVTVLLGRHVIP